MKENNTISNTNEINDINKNQHEKIAFEIYQIIGPYENIIYLTNCFTRLRINLKQIDKEKIEAIKKLSFVLHVIEVENQLQITIGNDVFKVKNRN